MNPMHAGNAQRIGCTAAKNSGFGTVGMHDVWLVLLQHAFQRKKNIVCLATDADCAAFPA